MSNREEKKILSLMAVLKKCASEEPFPPLFLDTPPIPVWLRAFVISARHN